MTLNRAKPSPSPAIHRGRCSNGGGCRRNAVVSVAVRYGSRGLASVWHDSSSAWTAATRRSSAGSNRRIGACGTTPERTRFVDRSPSRVRRVVWYGPLRVEAGGRDAGCGPVSGPPGRRVEAARPAPAARRGRRRRASRLPRAVGTRPPARGDSRARAQRDLELRRGQPQVRREGRRACADGRRRARAIVVLPRARQPALSAGSRMLRATRRSPSSPTRSLPASTSCAAPVT